MLLRAARPGRNGRDSFQQNFWKSNLNGKIFCARSSKFAARKSAQTGRKNFRMRDANVWDGERTQGPKGGRLERLGELRRRVILLGRTAVVFPCGAHLPARPVAIRGFPQVQDKKTRHCWGVVQPVGHLTVNEDGEGSNPSAPASFFAQQSSSSLPNPTKLFSFAALSRFAVLARFRDFYIRDLCYMG